MRVTGGIYGGRRLVAPEDARVRPTSDRTRQAIFNMLRHKDFGIGFSLEGAAVLDLFAGTGALGIEALAIHARFKYMNGRTSGRRRRRRLTSEDKEHSGVIEKIARAGDRELLRPGDFEPDSLAVAHGADAKPPWLDVDTFIPEAGLVGGDGDGYRAGNIEVDEVVAGGGVSYVDGLVIHSDGKGCGAQLRRNGDGLNPRSGEDDAREREYSRQEHTRSTQEAKILN